MELNNNLLLFRILLHLQPQAIVFIVLQSIQPQTYTAAIQTLSKD